MSRLSIVLYAGASTADAADWCELSSCFFFMICDSFYFLFNFRCEDLKGSGKNNLEAQSDKVEGYDFTENTTFAQILLLYLGLFVSFHLKQKERVTSILLSGLTK